ncbi:Ats1p NDAI_0H02510 [Naumovozyma dairenensis CBS 421]|uniref:Protein ATS1 n=1 Tax=Naumovozyma dairenensis (strain ATCC 10597 / BCRC 20456 / CBS 421 / NBRC 0211 / NRRL Y-12639) TaxID=1071378 RepID=G0WF64_NAUDC|nr:hypothetical protein NDAI_0H02510 [Naumovozyma dairenensis CBS 421]CCD26425.1 hypothetical protein NDAI_0H02510 [Naumovozyma dairenensis CBS 421]
MYSTPTYTGPARLKKIVCGGNHTILVRDDGVCFGCGDNANGQLLDPSTYDGDDDDNILKGWHALNGVDNPFADIVCGWEFTVMVDHQNNVFSRGVGLKGELGLGDDLLQSNTFRKVIGLEIARKAEVKLASSFQNCAVLVNEKDVNGEYTSIVYGWGSNIKCQLFKPRVSKSVTKPVIIHSIKTRDYNKTIDYVCMGKDFMLFVNKEGRITGTRGSIPKTFHWEEDWIDEKDLIVRCMWSSIHILQKRATPEGYDKITSYGYGGFGQIFDMQGKLAHNMKVKDFNIGSEHGILVLDDDNKVACWGWGEHGNCGPPIAAEGTTSTSARTSTTRGEPASMINDAWPLNTVMPGFPTGCEVRVFGGCANTWVLVQ